MLPISINPPISPPPPTTEIWSFLSIVHIVHLIAIHAGPTQLLLGVEPIAVETWIRQLLMAPTVLIVAEAHKHWRTE